MGVALNSGSKLVGTQIAVSTAALLSLTLVAPTLKESHYEMAVLGPRKKYVEKSDS